jgi:DNA-binding transcriptional ArsR family regulator
LNCEKLNRGELKMNNYNVIDMAKFSSLKPEQLEAAANMLKAIAHPMRIAILNFLEDGKKLTVTEIHELLEIEQSTTSHHLGILKDKGVLASRREGKNTYYFLKHENLSNIVECVSKCAIN